MTAYKQKVVIGDAVLYLGDCMDILPTLGKVDAVITDTTNPYIDGIMSESTTKDFDMKNVTDMQIGKAGEYLVCADLIFKGFIAFPSEQGLPYDVVADCTGKLIRIQVKTTREARKVPQRENDTPACLFNVRRCGKGGRQSYSERDIDVFALVDLETKDIGYVFVSDASQTMILRSSKHRGKYFNEVMAVRAALILSMREEGKPYSEISELTGVALATVARICTGKQVPKIEGVYLDEMPWEAAYAKV